MIRALKFYIPFEDIEKFVKGKVEEKYNHLNFTVVRVDTNYGCNGDVEFELIAHDDEIDYQNERRIKIDIDKI